MTPAALDEFLARRRCAFVGVSVVPEDPTRVLLRALRRRGHAVVAIRPGIAAIDGQRAYPSLAAVPGPLDVAVIATAPHRMERAVHDAAERGITRFWLDPGGLRGVPDDALDLCARRELVVAIGGGLPADTVGERLRRESRQLIQALVVSARLRVSD